MLKVLEDTINEAKDYRVYYKKRKNGKEEFSGFNKTLEDALAKKKQLEEAKYTILRVVLAKRVTSTKLTEEDIHFTLKETIRETLETARLFNLCFYKRTSGHNSDLEELTIDEAVDCLSDSTYCNQEEIHNFLADVLLVCDHSKDEASITYDWNTVWWCGDGCCSECDNYTLVIEENV